MLCYAMPCYAMLHVCYAMTHRPRIQSDACSKSHRIATDQLAVPKPEPIRKYSALHAAAAHFTLRFTTCLVRTAVLTQKHKHHYALNGSTPRPAAGRSSDYGSRSAHGSSHNPPQPRHLDADGPSGFSKFGELAAKTVPKPWHRHTVARRGPPHSAVRCTLFDLPGAPRQ
jgi:hypothetical protein